MCCFSVATPAGFLARLFPPAPVHVSATSIFARMIGEGRQALAYGMTISTRSPVAMILPLPVVPGSGEDAVRFVDLSLEPSMFADFRELFDIESLALARKGGFSFPAPQAMTLVVHEVGSFVASYVPTRADFDRLDPRFRMPAVLFDAVPRYHDYGFAVFQLAPGKSTVHPMAFTFPTREPERLYFPTVHVHDGRFHAEAKFDHSLYYQTPRCTKNDSEPFLGVFEDAIVGFKYPKRDYAGLVVETTPMLRKQLHGKLPNDDTWVRA